MGKVEINISRIIISFCALFALIFLSHPARAQLSISPTIVEETAYPGGLMRFTVNVGNTGDKNLHCTIGLHAMSVSKGIPVMVEEGPRCCRDWLTALPDNFELPAKTTSRLVIQVEPPRDVAGGYYALIACTGLPAGAQGELERQEGVQAGIEFKYRNLVPVLLTVRGAQVNAILDAAAPSIETDLQGGGYSLNLPVRNRGNIHARVAGYVEVRSHAGQLVDRFDLGAGKGFILPEHERLFTSRSKLSLPDGAYLAKISLLIEKSRMPMQNTFPFFVEHGQASLEEITDELVARLQEQSAGFTVSPPSMTITLRPGARRMHVVELKNLTRETLPVRAFLTEWQRLPDRKDVILDDIPPHNRTGASFVTIQEPALSLRPLSRNRVALMVSIPEGLSGDHYCALTLERDDIQLDASPEGRARRSVFLTVRAEGMGTTLAEITNFTVSRDSKGIIQFAVDLVNTGDLSILPQATFYLKGGAGNTAAKATPTGSAFLVQAGGEGSISATYNTILDPGLYSAEVGLRFDPNKPPLVRRTPLELPAIFESRQPPSGPGQGEETTAEENEGEEEREP